MSTVIDLKSLIDKEGGVSRSPSLSEDAASTLREMILLEKLPPGMALPERDLAEALNVSRTPMREAIRLLANEGLVSYTPSRRPYVADPSLEEINDYLRVQGCLEALAGELACSLASDRELATIADINMSIADAADAEGKLRAFRQDMQFHNAIVAAARNQALADTHKTYNARLWRVRFLSSQRLQGRGETRREHLEIVEALTARDPGRTAAALKKHLQTAETNIAAALDERAQAKQERSS
ncbi:MAG: GntR family transcriptional regulator [Pseudomonadota bacterium]